MRFILLAAAALVAHGDAPREARAPVAAVLKAEKLASTPDNPARSFDAIELRRQPDGNYAVRLTPEDKTLNVPSIDLRLLIPRVPRVASASDELTKIALIQREFNRNEVHHDLAGGFDFSIANNCLRQGLWEVKLGAKRDGKTIPLFHAWFDFPKAEYADLFEEVNGGRRYSDVQSLFVQYPKLSGLPVPLARLRRVESESDLSAVELHLRDPQQRLPEQQSKTKFLLTPALETCGDFSVPEKQPIVTARFSEPGFYNPDDPMRFDLSWIAHPKRVIARRVRPAAGGDPFTELDLAFANGYHIVFADRNLTTLVPRSEAPTKENDVLKIVSGIGTPVIHATATERALELAEDRPRYLFLLDGNGNLVDNHFAGMDGIYLWRETGNPGNLHVWVVGYERIAFVAHFSTPWRL
jgi:hypothetical protein